MGMYAIVFSLVAAVTVLTSVGLYYFSSQNASKEKVTATAETERGFSESLAEQLLHQNDVIRAKYFKLLRADRYEVEEINYTIEIATDIIGGYNLAHIILQQPESDDATYNSLRKSAGALTYTLQCHFEELDDLSSKDEDVMNMRDAAKGFRSSCLELQQEYAAYLNKDSETQTETVSALEREFGDIFAEEPANAENRPQQRLVRWESNYGRADLSDSMQGQADSARMEDPAQAEIDMYRVAMSVAKGDGKLTEEQKACIARNQ